MSVGLVVKCMLYIYGDHHYGDHHYGDHHYGDHRYGDHHYGDHRYRLNCVHFYLFPLL